MIEEKIIKNEIEIKKEFLLNIKEVAFFDIKKKLQENIVPNENSVIGLNQELIDQIIESKKCICKRDVSEEIIKYFQDLRAVVPPSDVSAIISDRSDSKVMEINDFKVKLN